ncbi:MAG TPA: flagellar hook-associated protein FlgK [Phycisphaerae bacterium]|nr:flagellar hook-associated protein FlgK [Phycisphaerae bacterium]
MSLLGALHTGGSSLAAQQAALQVTGNNISNAGTAGYSRQVVDLASTGPADIGNGQYTGNGVGVQSIERQVSAALNESVRGASSDQASAQTSNTVLSQLETTFGALNDNDLASRMTDFFNSFSTLANNPADEGQRAVVIQNGSTLAGYLQQLRGQVSTIGTNLSAQVTSNAQQANTLVTQIADLNKQIASTGTAGIGATNALLDQRDQALSQLAGIMDIKVIDQGGGNLNVLVGGMPVVQGTLSRGVQVGTTTDASGNLVQQLQFSDNGDTMNASGGTLGALLTAQSQDVTPALNEIDSIAAGLIQAVNQIHTQGQGSAGFTSVTGTTQVTDPTAALNASSITTGIAFPPNNGTFNLYITDGSGQTTTQQITVNLSGQGAQTTLNSLAASITAAGGGTVSASVDTAGHLQITSSDPHVTFGFGDDTSGALASLGVNTFFSGKNASDIAVNSVLTNDPDHLATGRDNVAGSNRNAQALALAGSAAVASLGGKSVQDAYAAYTADLAAKTQTASDSVTATTTIYQSLYAQQQSISGVSLDEEAINLTQYQRAFEGSARFINVVNQMMQTVLTLIQ